MQEQELFIGLLKGLDFKDRREFLHNFYRLCDMNIIKVTIFGDDIPMQYMPLQAIKYRFGDDGNVILYPNIIYNLAKKDIKHIMKYQ